MARKGDNIYKRKDGRWEGRYVKGYTPEGKVQYSSVYAPSYEEAKKKLLHLTVTHNQMLKTPKGNFDPTLADWVFYWLENLAEQKLKESTLRSYKHKLEMYVLPTIGKAKLSTIATQHVETLVNALFLQGYSANTIKTILRVLNAPLNSAVQNGFLHKSPCKAAIKELSETTG